MDKQKKIGLGLTSFILGLVGMLTFCIYIGIPMCVIAFVMSLIVLIKGYGGKGFAITGLSTSSVGLLFTTILICGMLLPDSATTTETETTTTQTQVETSTNVEQETIRKPTKEELAQAYKDECQKYNYKDVMRNPDNYIGKKIKIALRVSNVKNNGEYCFAYSDSDASGTYYDDKYVIYDKRTTKDFKLLEDDIIIVYGEIIEPQTETFLFTEIGEVFAINMMYVDLLDDY